VRWPCPKDCAGGCWKRVREVPEPICRRGAAKSGLVRRRLRVQAEGWQRRRSLRAALGQDSKRSSCLSGRLANPTGPHRSRCPRFRVGKSRQPADLVLEHPVLGSRGYLLLGPGSGWRTLGCVVAPEEKRAGSALLPMDRLADSGIRLVSLMPTASFPAAARRQRGICRGDRP
jgi:hypothetical protein